MKLKDVKMKPKLISVFLLVGLVPLALVGWWSSHLATIALMEKSYNQLEAVRGIKKAQIENYFDERKGDMGVLIETVGVLRKEAFAKLDAVKQIKKNQVEGYFSERLADASVLSGNDTVVAALEAFEQAFDTEGGRTGGTEWLAAESRFGPWLDQYKKEVNVQGV